MNRSLSQRLSWAIALTVVFAAAGTQSTGQTQTGAAGRPPARQEAPLLVMSPKAKSAGWTGVHKPHTKLQDVLARHKGQPDWVETIVDDERLIMLGKIRYKIEGLDQFEADEWDVVYVPRQTWHLASFGGREGLRSCRLAMNGFPYQAHMFEQD